MASNLRRCGVRPAWLRRRQANLFLPQAKERKACSGVIEVSAAPTDGLLKTDTTVTASKDGQVVNGQKANGTDKEKPETAAADVAKKGQQPWEVLTWNEKRTILSGLGISLFLAALDQNIVIIALPKIVEDLGRADLLAWVISAYMLTSCATMALYGRFSDVYGRRLVFLLAIGMFTIGSLLCGISTDIWFLIASRGIQGIGGGGMMSLAMIIVGDITSPEQRPVYMAGLSSVFGIASIIAPLLGGVLTDQATWRWVFFINLPFCVFAGVASFFAMSRLVVMTENLRLDVLGAVTIASSAICIVLFVTWGGSEEGYPWDSWIIIFLICMSVVLLVAFIAQELNHPVPIVNLMLFKSFNFGLVMFMMFFAGMCMLGGFAFLPVYFQNARGDGALIAGLKLIPMVFGFLFGAGIAGSYMTKTGKFAGFCPTGASLMSLGTGLFILLGLHTNFGLIFLYEVLAGAGMGILFPITSVIVQNSVPVPDMANALSCYTFFQTMGGAIGVAILGAVLNSGIEDGFKEGSCGINMFPMNGTIPLTPINDSSICEPLSLANCYGDCAWAFLSFPQITVDALHDTFLAAVIPSLVTWASSFFLRPVKLFHKEMAPA